MSQEVSLPSQNEVPSPLSEPKVLACSVCGQEDETVRAVVYPWLVSLLVVTFRRAFAGVWCQKHRRMRLFAASLMTSTLGWIGIPHGLLWTPGVLLTLARGGVQPSQPNADHLQALGEIKARSMDIEGAIRCLEASLKFVDNLSIRVRIQSLRSMNGLTQQRAGCAGTALTLVAVIAGAALTGSTLAVINQTISFLLSPLYANGATILFALISWAPFIALAFIGGLVIFRLVEWALTRIKCQSRAFAFAIGLGAAAVAIYGILQGDALAYYFIGLFTGMASSVIEAISTGIVIMLMGGIIIPVSWDMTKTSTIIYIGLLVVTAVYFLTFACRTALATARWQSRLHI